MKTIKYKWKEIKEDIFYTNTVQMIIALFGIAREFIKTVPIAFKSIDSWIEAIKTREHTKMAKEKI
jgi:hypothetical protein